MLQQLEFDLAAQKILSHLLNHVRQCLENRSGWDYNLSEQLEPLKQQATTLAQQNIIERLYEIGDNLEFAIDDQATAVSTLMTPIRMGNTLNPLGASAGGAHEKLAEDIDHVMLALGSAPEVFEQAVSVYGVAEQQVLQEASDVSALGTRGFGGMMVETNYGSSGGMPPVSFDESILDARDEQANAPQQTPDFNPIAHYVARWTRLAQALKALQHNPYSSALEATTGDEQLSLQEAMLDALDDDSGDDPPTARKTLN